MRKCKFRKAKCLLKKWTRLCKGSLGIYWKLKLWLMKKSRWLTNFRKNKKSGKLVTANLKRERRLYKTYLRLIWRSWHVSVAPTSKITHGQSEFQSMARHSWWSTMFSFKTGRGQWCSWVKLSTKSRSGRSHWMTWVRHRSNLLPRFSS